MTSIDLRDAEVQLLFTAIKKSSNDQSRLQICREIGQLYQKSQDYSFGIFTRIIKYISESNQRQQKKIGLVLLTSLGGKMQGTAKSLFVNKFHSPVFKLMENNQEEHLISFIEKAYEVILAIGGNRNDSAIQSNVTSCFQILQSNNAKDVKKIGGYTFLRILLMSSPYITFKKLVQKQRNNNLDNLYLVMFASRSKNEKVRRAYFKFLVQYLKYVADKKDSNFQKACFERFYDFFSTFSNKDTHQELHHLFIETITKFLIHLPQTIPSDKMKLILQYALDKIYVIKNEAMLQNIITIVPLLINRKLSNQIVAHFLKFLRGIEGQQKCSAQKAINTIIQNIQPNQYFFVIFKTMIGEICLQLKEMVKKQQNYNQKMQVWVVQMITISLLLKKYQNNYQTLVSIDILDELVSYAMIISVDQHIVKLLTTITKHNIHRLGRIIQMKFILVISKILTGNTRKVIRDNNDQLKPFIELLQHKECERYIQNQRNKINAIQSLSQYSFRQDLRDIVGGFVKDKVLKNYLLVNNSQMKIASIQSAFFLYAKKGKNTALKQLMQILDKLLRLGLTDTDQNVREKVFMSIVKNFKHHDYFIVFFTELKTLSYLFQAIEDSNLNIRIWALKIICILYNKNPSVMITPYLKQYTYMCFYHLTYHFKYYPNKEYLIKSIIVIIQYANNIIHNQIYGLLQILLSFLDQQNHQEVIKLLIFEFITILSEVLPNSLICFAESFSYHLIQAMKDKLNTKNRIAALKTFLNIIRNCGYVLIPYFQIPQLRQTLGYLLRSQIQQESRHNVMRIVGALGIADSLRYTIIKSNFQYASNSNLQAIFMRMRCHSNFLMFCQQISEEKINNPVDKQLKDYYDQLILLQNSKQVIKLWEQRRGERTIQSQEKKKTSFTYDFTDNFNMIIIKSLFNILSDVYLEQKHMLALDVLNKILQILSNEIQKDIELILPTLLSLAQNNQDILLSVEIIAEKCDVHAYAGSIIAHLLAKTPRNMNNNIRLINILTRKYNHSLRHFIGPLIHFLHSVIESHQQSTQIMIQISFIYQNIKAYLQPYLSVVIPQIINTFFIKNTQMTNAYLDLIMNLAKNCSAILQFMPLILHKFIHILEEQIPNGVNKPCSRTKLSNCIVLFVMIFKQQFICYLPMLHKALFKGQYKDLLYSKCVRYLENCIYGNINGIFNKEELQKLMADGNSNINQKFDTPKYIKKIEGIQELINDFDPVGKKIVEQQWIEWLKKTSMLLLKKSPSLLLRTCSVLADQYNQLGLELYNISFYHFWQLLLDEQKKFLVDNIKKILTYNPKPFLLIRKTFLNLSEFMSRKKCSFELSSSLLAQCAKDSSCFAKQLYYKEQEFEANPQSTIEQLIETYMRLGESQNAYGLFSLASHLSIKCKVEWYQKIGRYQQAYKSYRQIQTDKFSVKRLKCLSYLSDEKYVSELQKNVFNGEGIKEQLSLLAVEAYARLQRWQQCEKRLESMNGQSIGRQFWNAIVKVKKKDYKTALFHINKTRQQVYEFIPDIMNLNPTAQNFQTLILLQQLVELEQIIFLKEKLSKITAKLPQLDEIQKLNAQKSYEDSCTKLKSIWDDRLIGCSKNSFIYKKISVVRSLLFSKLQYFDFYMELCEIYIKEMEIEKCERLISDIKSQLTQTSNSKQLKFLELLEIKISFAENRVKTQGSVKKIQLFLQQNQDLDNVKIGHLYYLCGMALYDNDLEIRQKGHILKLLQNSARLCQSQKEWYIFAIMNLQFCEGLQHDESYQKYIINALSALISSLKITNYQDDYYLQSYLKLLSILCNSSKLPSVFQFFQCHCYFIPVQGWINVVPQLIAQLYQINEQSNFLKLLKLIFKTISKEHPESLLYPLNLALKSKIPERIKPASEIITFIKQKHPQLANQINVISNELGRAAIKLKQYWYDGIESAWSLYGQKKNPHQIIAFLKQICDNVFNRKQSNSEKAFHQQFGQEIRQGYIWLLKYEKTQEPFCISQVFQLFYGVYRKVKDCFQGIKKVYLKNVAPFLVTSKQYKSTIPGMYYPGKKCVTISGFSNQLTILQSKQRPRKLTIFGSDGKQYNFLLKGREDLRLDERVMQFFSLVNKLLANERQRLKKDLQITRYSIIPLTVNTGLIGWVQNCDTLNELIKDYRNINKIRVYVEKQLYEKMSPDYAYLPIMNKLQIFKNGLESTQGKDLQKILWIKSSNSEVWIQKRSNYTSSLATMSVVGYILGLGDRHPSNIMLQRDTGKIVHIDFGDCFQVAVLRQKFPQKVPFRLTRMLQKVMGLPGIHGIFRFTCEKVMKILRQNKQSLFGVLQTFAQDPIISWRLTKEKKDEGQKKEERRKDIKFQMIGSIMQGLEMQLQEKGRKQISDDVQGDQDIEKSGQKRQQINEKAIKALERIRLKLRGSDFDQNKHLTVEQQISRLIKQATSPINICQSWPGWCPFW